MSSEEESWRGRGGGDDVGEEEEEECPPPEDEKEMLFLIEFLIDTMLLKPENMQIDDMDPCLLQGQACIQLTFLHFPSMKICETDYDPCRLTGGKYIKFNSGKSLMFALSESQFENPPPIYLEVSAYKMLPHGTVPDKLHIGLTKICLVELFKQVFEKVEENPRKLPLSKSIKDNYQLVGTKSTCPTAEITIYIRLSCLGQNVVTEFQRGNDECEPFLFKSKESNKVYECKPKEMPGNDADELCPPLPGWGTSVGKGCPDGGGRKPYEGGGGCCGGEVAGHQGYAPNDTMDEDEFDEFGTELLGHALTIKVQKSQKRQPPSGDIGSGNQIAFQVPLSQNVCHKGRGNNKAELYNIHSAEGENCGAKEPLRIVHGVDSPDKDIFVVRIGKKGEMYGKGKLELELRTPKVRIERPPMAARKWDKMVQTEREEQPKKGKKKK